MRRMPPQDGLSELDERILLALWKLRGIGRNYVKEQALRADLADETGAWVDSISNLCNRGFLEKTTVDGQDAFAITSLGLSVLRQTEENKLQELQ